MSGKDSLTYLVANLSCETGISPSEFIGMDPVMLKMIIIMYLMLRPLTIWNLMKKYIKLTIKNANNEVLDFAKTMIFMITKTVNIIKR